MRNLLERLKPEVKEELELQKKKYKHTVNDIFDTLASKTFYSELTMGDIQTLHTFSHYEITRISSYDLRWGEHMFNNK
jgi:hypothetical protein